MSKIPPKEVLIEDCRTLSGRAIRRKYHIGYPVLCSWLGMYGINGSDYFTISTASKRMWQDQKYKKLQNVKSKEVRQSNEYKLKHSERCKKHWQDPEYRKKTTAALAASPIIKGRSRKQWQDPEYKSKMKALYATDEYKAKASQATKKQWQDPEYRQLQTEIHNSIEFKNKLAIARENTPITLTKPHLKVCELLTSLGVQYTTEKAVGPWVFDIFIESANILIEVQGDYWHNLPRVESRDRAKSTYVAQHPKQYRLYYIWEHECLTEGSVLAKLKHWLGLDIIEQVGYEFNQVVFKPILDAKQADTFLYNWHYQHHGRHGLDLGGYLGNELVCLARFTNPSRAEIATSLNYAQKQVLELARLVVHPKYQKKNLCSWFLTRCERYIKKERPEIECLVSFADSTHNHTGIVYKAANWELNRIVEPNYWYIDQDGWMMHKKTLWNHARSLKVSEAEYAEKKGFTKAWGKEKYKFIKRLGHATRGTPLAVL